MSITVGWWALPTVATVVVWAFAICWPIEPQRGDYGFGYAIDVMLRGGGAIIVTLLAWLIYFALRAFLN